MNRRQSAPKKFKNKNVLAFIVVVLLSIAIILYLGLQKRTLPETENLVVGQRKTVYPTQYSDKHITTNAVISDPRFRNLVILNKEDFLASAITSINKNKTGLGTKEVEKGTWLWTAPLSITTKYRDSIIAGAKKNNIHSIYLSIDTYLDIFTLPDNLEKDKKKQAFGDALESFIVQAHKNNISVDAEGGWRNWAEAGNYYKAFAVLDYATEFNKTHKNKLRGFQYDVEPYLLESYEKDKVSVLSNFINLINQSIKRMGGSDLDLSVVIPEFYDDVSGSTPEFSYAGKSGYAFDHLLDVLDKRAGSKIIIMAYRNLAKGDDGAIDISKDEVAEANMHKTRIIIAQEIGDVLPPYVTFHNTSRSYYQKQVGLIEKTFSNNKSFGGIATHYVNALMELE